MEIIKDEELQFSKTLAKGIREFNNRAAKNENSNSKGEEEGVMIMLERRGPAWLEEGGEDESQFEKCL